MTQTPDGPRTGTDAGGSPPVPPPDGPRGGPGDRSPVAGGPFDRWRSTLATRPTTAIVLVFALGLLVGWLVIGWWLYPVEWTGGTVGDLTPNDRRQYVGLVAAQFARDQDAAAARERLVGIAHGTLADDLARLAAGSPHEDVRGGAGPLAIAMGLPAVTAAGEVVGDTGAAVDAPSGGDTATVRDFTRNLALLALVAAAAAGVALAWAWVWWRRDSGGGATGPLAPPVDAALRREQARVRGAPPWRPLRIDLGDSATARYRAEDERYYQTWLVYDERGGLVGGAGLQSHPVGSVNALDLWFFKREEDSVEADTPMVTIVAQAAFRDGVFRARLGERKVVAAVPGQGCVLEAADLALDARIEAVEPAPDSDSLGLTSVVLTLTPHRLGATDDDEIGPDRPLLFWRG